MWRPRWILVLVASVGLIVGACESFSGTPEPDAGTDSGATAGDAGVPREPCEGFDAGPKMAHVVFSGASFCVDTLETSVAQYRAFLLAPDAGAAPPIDAGPGSSRDVCTDFARENQETRDDHPASVGFCAARAYCAWAGKRLCSAVYKPVKESDNLGEWFLACSPTGADYPWGNEPSDAGDAAATGIRRRCPAAEGADIRPVGSSPDCRGPDGGTYDMIGNAGEWVEGAGDVTDIDGGEHSFAAAVRGRSLPGGQNDCKYAGYREGQRIAGDAVHFGFRCCADPKN